MKILFYDGYMPGHNQSWDAISAPDFPDFKKAFDAAEAAGLFYLGYRCISAADGPTRVMDWVGRYYSVKPNGTVITNSVIALDNTYAWNDKTNSCDIWFWKNGEWVNIQDTTEREIRQGHSIMHMYLNGAFDL